LLVADPGINTPDAFSEPTEMEYLRKVLFEYMMGRETKVCFSFLHFKFDYKELSPFVSIASTLINLVYSDNTS